MVSISSLNNIWQSFFQNTNRSEETTSLSDYFRNWSRYLLHDLPQGLRGRAVIHNTITNDNPKFRGFYENSAYISEGQGYGLWIMLGANNEEEFDNIWTGLFDTLGTNELGLIPWARHLRGACLPITSFDGISGENSAIDADFDILAAGITAYNRYRTGIWRGRKTEAELQAMRDQLVNLAKNLFEEGVEPLEIGTGNQRRTFYVLKSTDGAGRRNNVIPFYTSYAAPAWYQMTADFLQQVETETRGFQGVEIVDLHKGKKAVELRGLSRRYQQLRQDTLGLMEQIAGNPNLRNHGHFPAICDITYNPRERNYAVTVRETDDIFDASETLRIPWRLGVDARWYGNQRSLNLLNTISPQLMSTTGFGDITRLTGQFMNFARGQEVNIGSLNPDNCRNYYEGTIPLLYAFFLNNNVRAAENIPTFNAEQTPFALGYNRDALTQIPVAAARDHFDRNISAQDNEVSKNYLLGVKNLLNVSMIESIINGVRGFFGKIDQNDFAEAQRYTEKIVQESGSERLYSALPFMTDIMKDMGIPGRHVVQALTFARQQRMNNKDINSEDYAAATLIDHAVSGVRYTLDRRFVTANMEDLTNRTYLPPLLECDLIRGFILERKFNIATQLINLINQRNLNLRNALQNLEAGNYAQTRNIISNIVSHEQDLVQVTALRLTGQNSAADSLLAQINQGSARELQRAVTLLDQRKYNEATTLLRNIVNINQQPVINSSLSHLTRLVRYRTTNVETTEQANSMISDGENYLEGLLASENRYAYLYRTDSNLMPLALGSANPLLLRDNYIDGLNTYLDFIENSTKSLVIRDNNLDNMRATITRLRAAGEYGLSDAATLLLPGTGTLVQRTLQRIQAQAETYSKIFSQQMDVRTLFMELLVYKAENNPDSTLERAEEMREQITGHISDRLLDNITIYGDTEIENAYISPLKVLLNIGFSNLQTRNLDQELRLRAIREVRARHNLAVDTGLEQYQTEINTLTDQYRTGLGRNAEDNWRRDQRDQIIALLSTYPRVAQLLDSNNLLGRRGQVNKSDFISSAGINERQWDLLVANNFIDAQGRILGRFVGSRERLVRQFENLGITDEHKSLRQVFLPAARVLDGIGSAANRVKRWFGFQQPNTTVPAIKRFLGLNSPAENVHDILQNQVNAERERRMGRLDSLGQDIREGIATLYRNQENNEYGYFFNSERYLPFIAELANNLYWSGDDELRELGVRLLESGYQDEQRSENLAFQLQYWKIMADHYTGRAELQHAYEEVRRLEAQILRIKGPNSSEYLSWLVIMGNLIFNAGMMRERFYLRGKIEEFVRNNQQVINILDDDLPERIQLYKIFGDIVNEENPAQARNVYYAQAERWASRLENLHLLSGPMRAWIYLQLYKSTQNPVYRTRIEHIRRTWIHDSRFRRYYNEAFM